MTNGKQKPTSAAKADGSVITLKPEIAPETVTEAAAAAIVAETVKTVELTALDSYDSLFTAYDKAVLSANVDEKARIRDMIVTKSKQAQSDGDSGNFRFNVDAENKVVFMVTANNRYRVTLNPSVVAGKVDSTVPYTCVDRALPPRLKNELVGALKAVKFNESAFWTVAPYTVTGEPS